MAAPAKTISEDNNPYAVNKALFEEATEIKNKMSLLERRIAKMDEHRREVSESVYLKVKSDYGMQLDEIKKLFSEKCKVVDAELKTLYQAQSEQESSLHKHQEILEEAKFRNKLGEYDENKFKDLEGQQNREIKKYNEILSSIQMSIRQYEDVLGPRGAVSENTLKTSSTVAEKKKATALTAKPDDDLDLLLESEGDYFNPIVEKPTAIPAVEPPIAKPEKIIADVSTSKPDNDSISDILRNIPGEENIEAAVTKVAAEETGANIDIHELSGEASLLLLEGDLSESEFILRDNTSIGRSPSNDIVLKESKISRQHATINQIDGNYVLVDLKSANGVYVNGKKVEEATLKDGDQLSIGSFKFQFNTN